MINQIPISVKIDAHIWKELEQEVSLGYKNRNRIINDAIRIYVEFQDLRRKIKCSADLSSKKRLIRSFLDRWDLDALE